MIRSRFIRCALAAAWLAASAAAGMAMAQGQDYPNRKVTVYVPFGPGGSGDVLLRTITDRLADKWKQPVVIDYKPGAGGLLAHEFVAKAPADGYTLLQGAASFTLYNLLNKDMRFDPLKDLTIAAMTGQTAISFVTSNEAPVKTMQEWIVWAKANPGKLNYASLGRSVVMMSMELLASQAGVKLQEVPFKAQQDQLQAVMRNDVQLALLPVAQSKQFADRLKPLFVVGPTRFADLPNVPTNAEAGLPNFRPIIWQSIMAPSGTPRAALQRINADVSAIVAQADYPGMAEKAGMRPFSANLDEIKKLTDEQVNNWTAVARALNIQPE